MDDVKIIKLLHPPEQKNPTIKPSNANKYYKYHQNSTHNMNKCVTLKNKIEDLIHKAICINIGKPTKANPNRPTN